MIEVVKHENLLALKYTPNDYTGNWVNKGLSSSNAFSMAGIFKIGRYNLISEKYNPEYEEDAEYLFRIGELVGDYYLIDQRALDLRNQFHFFKDLTITLDFFLASSRISILRTIDANVNEPIYIGGVHETILPFTEFERLIGTFPGTYEVSLYRSAKVTSIIKNYFETTIDKELTYNNYLNKKKPKKFRSIKNEFREYEVFKFSRILLELKEMLAAHENYSEHEWQQRIIDIILLLYPKYIQVLSELRFKDEHSGKNRRLDLALLDFQGNLDLIEIKRPFSADIVSQTRYRENHIPNRDLSGTIMQIEKYIYHLNRAGINGEKELNKKYNARLPEGLELKIVNPRAMIIMGRDNTLSSTQLGDFEIIKRKYKNVMDIITYDELIGRLERVIEKLQKGTS